MKTILSALFATIGISSAVYADQTVKMVDPKTVRFSMPTVAADDIQYVMPTKESFEGAPQFHEDEWGQLEFFPRARLAEIQKLLKEFNAFEKTNRTQYGWIDPDLFWYWAPAPRRFSFRAILKNWVPQTKENAGNHRTLICRFRESYTLI